jgi:hypothetical protein
MICLLLQNWRDFYGFSSAAEQGNDFKKVPQNNLKIQSPSAALEHSKVCDFGLLLFLEL